MDINLDLGSLQRAYADGLAPSAVVDTVYDRITQITLNPIWISLVPRSEALDRASELEHLDRSKLPLFGIPFAVKDNIDVEGMPTTAACPAYSYKPKTSATVVKLLLDAGAILIGKTNMDQFATGLVGTRSPYGVCSSIFDERYISGGSSSGSAIAVAGGLVTFSLGTDTAGSGRVPAAFNNIIGLKPTKGTISTTGVVPACRSLDCVSIFALTSGDAAAVLDIAERFDVSDPYSRDAYNRSGNAAWTIAPFRFGVPKQEDWQFFGDSEAQKLYELSIEHLAQLGGTAVEFDLSPFKEVASLLYAGPWVAERFAAIESFITSHREDMNSVVGDIISAGESYSAVDTFRANYQLEHLRKSASKVWDSTDLLMLPTTGTIYRIEDVLKDPIALNSNLGYYTNFVNLLDLCGVAVPAGFRPSGLPFGITLIGKPFAERSLLQLADRLHRKSGASSGADDTLLSTKAPMKNVVPPAGWTLLAVVGAHLKGQPLNHQLTSRGARLVSTTNSAACYQLYALPNTAPPKPGLVRKAGFNGGGIEMEVWAMPTEKLGSFVAEIPPPLGIGTVELNDGSSVKGFICEPAALEGATEITHFGGWRNYLAR